MSWWFFHRKRPLIEKEAVTSLEASVDWLRLEKWYINVNSALCLNFQILVNDENFRLKMVYPSAFPYLPPMIYNEDKSLISSHQYGAEGELCLEYRPDNWQLSNSGAEMIASAQRLLSTERPEKGVIDYAQSDHVASLGSDMRGESLRFLLTEGDIKALNALPKNTLEPSEFNRRIVDSTNITSLLYVGKKENPLLVSDLKLPNKEIDISGFVVGAHNFLEHSKPTVKSLRLLLVGSVNFNKFHDAIFNTDACIHILIGNSETWKLCCMFGPRDDREILPYKTLQVPCKKQRLSEEASNLHKKKVAIVGCGSVGSKIAVSLCRSGVGHFIFIDEDIFFPDNVVRNELDISYTGIHKTRALHDYLLNINPSVEIKTYESSLGGQESSRWMSSIFNDLEGCDLLIDATANATAFYIIALISTRKKKPMIWVEVFGGGSGGIVARACPDIDPTPMSVRNQIDQWFENQGEDWTVDQKDAGHYGVQGDDGLPMIADDAEVSVMAAHGTRFASDILAQQEGTIFPYSVYVIGLSSEKGFKEPFHTYPIKLISEGDDWGETTHVIEPEALLEILNDDRPVKKDSDADRPA